MIIFPPGFQIILFAISPKVPEDFKEKYSQISSKIHISSEEIWQLSNVYTAFLLSTAVLLCQFDFRESTPYS